MKGMLFLGLVGAALYGAIVLSYDLLPHDPGDDAFASKSLGDPGDRQLRSWGTDLPALTSSSSQGESVPLRGPASKVTLPSRVAGLGNAQSDGTAYQAIEWAKVVLAAKVHSDASVSSPTLRFYEPGVALQVVGRQNAWVQVTDPASGERGWVFEQYLVPTDGPTAAQTAMATVPNRVVAEPANPARSAKKRWAARPVARTPHNFAAAQFDRRWDRRIEHRGFGLFFFGRFARAE